MEIAVALADFAAGSLDLAGVKVVGDYVDNYQRGLPSELALLTLYTAQTGVPIAIIDATRITWMRTGAVSANRPPAAASISGCAEGGSKLSWGSSRGS